MRQVVVQPEIGTLRIHGWDTVPAESVEAKALIHPEDGFNAPNEAVEAAEGAAAVGGLNPVALRVLPASVL